MKLILAEPSDSRTRARVSLKPTYFLNLTLYLRFRAGLVILAKPLTVDASIELKNDFSEGCVNPETAKGMRVFFTRIAISTAQ